MKKEVVVLKKLNGRKGAKVDRGIYERRVEALKDIFMLWGEISYSALEQHLEDHPGIEEQPSSWLADLLEDLQVKGLVSLQGEGYLWKDS